MFVISKGIKQRRACLYPVSETCYDAAEHEKALSLERKRGEAEFSFCFTSVLSRHSMFLKLDINTSDAFVFLLENNSYEINIYRTNKNLWCIWRFCSVFEMAVVSLQFESVSA